MTALRRRTVLSCASAVLVTAVVASGVVLAGAGTASAASPEPTSSPSASSSSSEPVTTERLDASGVASYGGDPEAEALVSSTEDRRLIEVRAIANAADWSGVAHYKPYRLATGNLYTLVLVARDAPYTLSDLEDLAPRTFRREPDGSWLLSENIVVEDGATLDLSDKDGLTLHLQSNSEAFASIVTLGGSLVVAGTYDQPTRISSWDPDAGAVDTDTSDGRAYIRVVGGHAELSKAFFTDLGFWSGMTGGVSMTGTDIPDKGTDTLARKGTNASDSDEAASAAAAADDASTEVFGTELLPTDEASVLDMDPDLSGYSYVSAMVRDVTFDGNAFGLFVTSADGVVVRDSAIKDSLVDGMVFHRNVSNSEVENTTSTGNALDGFDVNRASSGIVLQRLTATGNGKNGITMNGRALAEGPSATGMPTGVYGNNSLSNSKSSDNARYGVEVIGGTDIEIDGNTMTGNEVGIVVGQGAEKVALTDNTIEESSLQGIALRAAGTGGTIKGNTISGGDIGIYLRDAGASISRNTVEDVDNHAITLIGATGTSRITDNVVSGRGPSAIDTARTENAVRADNDDSDWRSTKPLGVVLRSIFQPLTIMWLSLALILVVTAITSVGRNRRGFVHPYANLAPLSTFTRGEASRDEVGPPATPRGSTA
jgi:parallel beta-helix repeat protein